jgi:DNA-binding HxlR family transcriptional regulator
MVRIGVHAGNCAVAEEVVSLLGEKWTVLVLGALAKNPRLRYNELQRAVAGISQRMLTLTVKKLESNGLVKRTLFPSVPPRVDYELTPLGHELVIPVRALLGWVREHGKAMADARQAYAATSKKSA